MAIKTIDATIQMRRGLEQDFDADQMTAGEWAVSTDKKYVRMCFTPGLCYRMATYEAFEQDMKEIQTILATCQDIQVAIDFMAKLSEQHKNDAEVSAAEAKASEVNAKISEDAAKMSQSAAEISENNAKISELNALNSQNLAESYAKEVFDKVEEAELYATNAELSNTEAKSAVKDAINASNSAALDADTATQKASEASASEKNAEEYSKMSKSWAVGEGGMRLDEAVNNSKYFAEQAARLVNASGSGGLIPMGTIMFENLPMSGMKTGWMYNISNDFVSDDRFEDGGNIMYKAGANIYWTYEEKWDVLTGIQVTGVKGDSESSYRTGNVNLTADNINALSLNGGTIRSVSFPSLKIKRTTSGSSGIELFPDNLETESIRIQTDSEEDRLRMVVHERLNDGNFQTLLHLSRNYRRIYDTVTNSMKKILVEGEAYNEDNPPNVISNKKLSQNTTQVLTIENKTGAGNKSEIVFKIGEEKKSIITGRYDGGFDLYDLINGKVLLSITNDSLQYKGNNILTKTVKDFSNVEEGEALDSTLGKQLKDELDSQNISFAKSLGDLNTSLSQVNNKITLSNLVGVNFSMSSDYVDMLFRVTNNHMFIFRAFRASGRLAMYESTNGGTSYTTLWDRPI